MFMVDIAVPRDIEPEVGTLSDVYLYTVDDLHEVIEEGRQSREEAAEQAPGDYVDFFADRTAEDFDAYWLSGAKWTMTDGILRGEHPEHISWIFTKENYDDFILSFDVMISEGGNAGITIRFPWPEDGSTKTGPARLGYEIQILDDHSYSEKNPAGSICGRSQ